MAIHTKVGILTHVPGSTASETPGLINGVYADFLTKEFDFLDDPRMAIQNAWFTNDPWEYTNHHTHDWEDIGYIYRSWRDQYNRNQNEYWLVRQVRAPFEYKNFIQDPNAWANPLETIRLVWPAPNGEFNLPYPNPTYSDGYSFYNANTPLKHNLTRITLPIIDSAFAVSVGSNLSDILEDQNMVRDNQAAIDAKQLELDSLIAEWNAIIPLIDAKNLEYGTLLDSGADQGLIDTAYAELQALQSQVEVFGANQQQLQGDLGNLQNASNWIYPNTMSTRNTEYRANRDAYFKAMNELGLGTPLSSLNGMVLGVYKESFTEEDIAAMKDAFLNFDMEANNPSPWSDERYRFAWDNGQNPVTGAYNTNIWDQFVGDEGQLTMTNHPEGTMPFEVLPGVTSINRLPAVVNTSLLPAVGNPGDVIRVSGDEYAWDPQNGEWSQGFYRRFIEPFDYRMRPMRDAKLKAKNEMTLAMKPFVFACLHVPAFSLESSNVIVK